MSLVDQSLPPREVVHSSEGEAVEQKQDKMPSYRDSLPGAPQPIYTSHDTYDDTIFDEFYDNMMTDTHTKAEAVEQPPALPMRSARRASRMLDGLGLGLATPQPAEITQETPHPHDVYLSSEEDASSSADDFSDYDFDSDSDVSPKSPMGRRSHEDTARVVSVVYAGKPSLIDLSLIRRSMSPSSLASRQQSSRGSSSNESSPSSSSRRISTSSVSTASISQQSFPHPPRSSSIISSLLPKQKPQFLNIDPFAGKSYHEMNEEEHGERGEQDTPRTPKTPTAMFRRTLSLVRKKSRPMLNNLNSTQTLPIEAEEPKQEAKAPEPAAQPPRPVSQQAPVTYQDIIRAAKKNAMSTPMSPIPQSPQSPASPAGSSRRVFASFTMNRRRSIKAS